MKYLLSGRNVDVLAQIAWSNVLLGFDFDGTLSPIVPQRDAARMRLRTRQLFARICRQYPCAVISGRSRIDLKHRLKGTTPRFIVGNHGMEPGAESKEFARQMSRAQTSLATTFANRRGIEIENKRYSLAVHYRGARHQAASREGIEDAVVSLPDPMRIIHGKSVVNILPAAAPNKGDALMKLRRIAGVDTALFVGDDLTDEDIFALDQPGRLLTVRIGPSRASSALFYLQNQREIDTLLVLLHECRLRETRG